MQGNNHPDDVDSMVRLYRRFRTWPLMLESVSIWAESDGHVDELAVVAGDLHERLLAGDTGSPELRSLGDRAELLRDRLVALNQRFSVLANEAARSAERFVRWGMFFSGLLITLVGVGVSWYLMRREAQTARALRESNERWTLATAAAGIGVFDWDLNRDQLTIDARAAALCGLPAQDTTLDGSALANRHVHAEDAPGLRRALRGAIEHPSPINIRCRVGPEPQRMRHLQLNARTRARDTGTRLIGIVSDVSDDVQAQQLRLEKESAERANRAKSSFLSRVSHELRTPLNAVLGFGQLMHTDPAEPLTAGQTRRLEHVLDAAHHLLELINDLLDITGLENDGVQLQQVAVRLDDVVSLGLAHVRPLAQAAQVEVTLRHTAGGDDLTVQGDAMRLRQCLEHVLANAVKFNRADGHVELTIGRDEASGDAADGPARAVIAVQDTGPGLSAQQLDRLFQPFDRLGAENSPVPGSGLGLVITQQLLQRMGGSLDVSSQPGRGTRVELRLPLWVPAEAAAPAAERGHPGSSWPDGAAPAGA
jgi:signal transduction histidine kinase